MSTRHSVRFLIPPSLGSGKDDARGIELERYFSKVLGKMIEASVATSYETLAKELLGDKAEVAWAPPFVCARLEAMGVRIVARGVRGGASTYRSTLICRAGVKLAEDRLQGTTAAWIDRDSVAGYILPLAHLRAKGLDPSKLFFAQEFVGSYRAALEAVLNGKADVTGVFTPTGGDYSAGIEQVLPGKSGLFAPIGYTDDVPNDGVAISVGANPATASAVEKALLSMHETPEGERVLKEIFHVEKFEAAPRLGYRALYRVALASL